MYYRQYNNLIIYQIHIASAEAEAAAASSTYVAAATLLLHAATFFFEFVYKIILK